MTAMLLPSILIPVLTGVALTFLCFPPRRFDFTSVLFHFSLGTGIGFGVLSCFYFLAMLPAGPAVLFRLDLLFAILSILLSYFLYKTNIMQKRGILPLEEKTAPRRLWIIPALFTGTLVSALVAVLIAFLREPHGKWDAWVIWNLHARFILRGGEHWQSYFSSGLDWTHADYPLLTPLSVVRMWLYTGSETLWGPFLLSVLFMLAVTGLLVSSLALLRGRSSGFLAGLVLMGSPYFLDMASFQFADIPLAFFFLATLIIFALHDRLDGRGDWPLMLAGLTAALAAWTKNEGLLFLLIVPLIRFACVLKHHGWRKSAIQAGWFIAGALPVVLVVIAFKVLMAPGSDLFAAQGLLQMIGRLTDPARYARIALAYLQTALTFTQGVVNIRTGFQFNPGVAGIVLLAVYTLLMGVRIEAQDRPALGTVAGVIVVMLAGYFGIYLVTPHDLHWHITTSLNRLFLQLWPAAVFLCFMAVRTPEEAMLAPNAAAVSAPRTAKPGASGETGRKASGKQKRRRGELS